MFVWPHSEGHDRALMMVQMPGTEGRQEQVLTTGFPGRSSGKLDRRRAAGDL